MSRIDLLGCPVDDLTLDDAVAAVDGWMSGTGTHRHVSVSASKVHKMATDPGLRDVVRESDLVTADGVGILIGARALGLPPPRRVTGIALFLALIERAATRGWRPYFIGSKRDVVEAVVRRFQHIWPELDVAGWRDGYFGPEQEEEVAAAVRASNADLLFVAMGSPRQEHFLAARQAAMGVKFAMGVGGSFDVVANRARRSPPGVGDRGLEWAWRLAQEPGRLWRRNLVENGGFLAMVVAGRVLGRRLPE